MSLVGVYDAEWRTRKINLFNILRSFVYQLRPGDDLTKISLPSELCHPFSMLELIAYRELQLFHLLFEINQFEDAVDRFGVVLKWYMGMVREETVEKKPFNPVIEETHLCWVQHDEDDFSEFIGEQVSHHPPVSAFVVCNRKHGIKISGSVTFQVGFGTNCASVMTGGKVTIETNKEKYTMTKCMPDMMVNNVVWGEKYLMWHGGVTITSDTGYTADVELREEDHRNLISGKFNDPDGNLIYTISGIAGKSTFIQKPDQQDKQLLIDITKCKENLISYIPTEALDPLSTLKIWVPVKDAIVVNDLDRADQEKKIIEADQRVRESQKLKDGLKYEGQYFVRKETEGEEEIDICAKWDFKDNITIDEKFLSEINRKAEEVKAQKQSEPEEEPVKEEVKQENCAIQ